VKKKKKKYKIKPWLIIAGSAGLALIIVLACICQKNCKKNAPNMQPEETKPLPPQFL